MRNAAHAESRHSGDLISHRALPGDLSKCGGPQNGFRFRCRFSLDTTLKKAALNDTPMSTACKATERKVPRNPQQEGTVQDTPLLEVSHAKRFFFLQGLLDFTGANRFQSSAD